MSKQIIPNGSKVNTEYGVFEVLDCCIATNKYFCYKKDFEGHSGEAYFGHKYQDTKYEDNCWWFFENEVSLIEESEVIVAKQPKFKAGDKVVCTDKDTGARGVYYAKEYTIENPSSHFGHYYGKTHNHVTLVEVESTPSENSLEMVKETKDYRKMKPTDLIDIVLDGKEFKVPLGDLVHAKALLGVTNGLYGYDLWKSLEQLFNEDGFIEDYDTVFEFVEKQRQVIQHFFKPHYDEQQKKDLEAQIVAKSNELLELQTKLKELI